MMDLPEKMTAIAISKPGGPEVLVPEELPVPAPKQGEVLVKVAAAGVNRPDCLQRAGGYPPPPGAPDTPGLEIAGEIVALGEEVDAALMGAKVMALVPGGGYAQYCVAHACNTLPIPDGLSMEEAAAIPETFFTVWHNVFQRGGLQAGERFLVHGGSSGIGTTAIQLAKAFGAIVMTTAGSPEKCEACLGLGADCAINYRTDDFVSLVGEFTSGKGVDLILDMVGGDYIARNIRAMADEGRLVQIAFLSGPKVELNFAPMMMRRLTITGSTLRPQSDLAKARIAEALREHVWPMIAAGRLAPLVDSEYPLAEAAAAHARMESSGHIGKIVLKVA